MTADVACERSKIGLALRWEGEYMVARTREGSIFVRHESEPGWKPLDTVPDLKMSDDTDWQPAFSERIRAEILRLETEEKAPWTAVGRITPKTPKRKRQRVVRIGRGIWIKNDG